MVVSRNLRRTLLQEWWPGIDKVDYCGVSIFQQAYGDSPMGDLATAREIASFCRDHKKPLMIAESTPFGVGDAGTPRHDLGALVRSLALDFIREDVAVWCYINDNWDAQMMWTEGGTFWGDSRVEAYPIWLCIGGARSWLHRRGSFHLKSAGYLVMRRLSRLCLCALPWLVRRKT